MTKKPVITITISGNQGSGKSTAAQIIRTALSATMRPFTFKIVEVTQ